MAIFEITAPDGKTYEVQGNGTEAQALAHFKANWKPSQEIAPQQNALQQAIQEVPAEVNPFEAAMRQNLKNVGPTQKIMGGMLGGLGGETIKNIGALTELASPSIGKPIAQFGQAMTNVSKEANPITGTIGQIGAYVAPTSILNKAIPSLERLTQAVPKSISLLPEMIRNAGMGGALGFGLTEGTGKEGMMERGKEALLNAGLGVGMPLVGSVGSKISGLLRGPEQSAQMANAVEKARNVGYVIPPTQARESLLNRVLEGTSGKITTQQNASAKNQEITHDLVSKALGLPEKEVITPEILKDLRNTAGQAYENLKLSGRVTPDKTYHEALDNIVQDFRAIEKDFPADKLRPEVDLIESLKSKSFEVNSALAKIKTLRADASKAYSQGDASLGSVNKKAANVIEDAIESHLANTKQTELLDKFKDARQLIAKTYTVEKALNPSSGTVDARKLATELKRGKPLTDELKTVAEFAGQFPKAAQTTEMMGGRPQINPLDVGAAGILSALTNPAAMATVAARPAARSLALSPLIQNRLIQPPAGQSNQNAQNLAKMLMLQQTTQGGQ